MLVHFPLAFLLAAGGFYAYALWKNKHLDETMAWRLHLLGIVGLVAAVLSGRSAVSGVVQTERIRNYIETHELTGNIVLWMFLLLALWRYLRAGKLGRLEAWLFVGVFLLASALMVWGAWEGGHVVYDHGAGVRPMAPLLEEQLLQEQGGK